LLGLLAAVAAALAVWLRRGRADPGDDTSDSEKEALVRGSFCAGRVGLLPGCALFVATVLDR